MSILYRYIAVTALTSTALVLLVLVGLYSFMDFVSELDDLGKGNYDISTILAYMLYSMPKRIYELLPIAALLGSVMGLGTLATQSELVAMRAAGLSMQQINNAVAMVALILMLLTGFIGEVLRPPAEQKAKNIQSLAQTGSIEMQSKHGFWTRNGLHFNHVGEVTAEGQFGDIVIYEFDQDNQLRIVTRAKRANYENGEWLLQEVLQSRIGKDGVRIEAVERASWITPLNPGIVNIVAMNPALLPIWKLVDYIDYLKVNRQSTQQHRMAFWSKLMLPISAAVMVFLAVPFVFGPLRSAPIGGRILAGALVGVGFHLINQSFQHIGLVFELTPWLAATLPTLIFGVIAWFMNKKLH